MTRSARVKRLDERADAGAVAHPAPIPPPSLAPSWSPAGMLWLQRRVGNRALARYVGPGGGGGTALPQFWDAMNKNEWLDGAPMRTLNSLLDVPGSEDRFTEDTFHALVVLAPTSVTPGVIDDAMVELLIERAVQRGLHTQAAHMVEQRIFSGTRIDLSLRYDPALRVPSKVVREGPLNAVTLGPAAFGSLATLEATISAALPPIAGPTSQAAPQRIAGDALKEAVSRNQLELGEFVSGGIVAGAIGGHDDDPSSEEFAQWIADFQQRQHTPVNGRLDDATMAKIVERLRQQGHFGSLLRLVIDYGSLDRTLIADARFNRDVSDEFWIDRSPRGTSSSTASGNAVTVDFGPKAFLGGFAGILHTVADAFKQVEARHEGLSEPEQRLLGKAEQLTRLPRPGLLESAAAMRADVRDFLAIWRSLRPDDRSRPDPRRRHLDVLKQVVERTEERFKLLGMPNAREVRRLKFALSVMEPD